MRGKIKKLDNVCRIAIPPIICAELGLKKGDYVQIDSECGRVVITPTKGYICPTCGARSENKPL